MKEIQMTEASTIFTPLEEVKGTGKIHSENNLDAEVDFHLQILKNGKGIGTVFFKTVHPNINHFSIFGSVANTLDEVTVEDCYRTGTTDSEVRFSFLSLKIFHKSLKLKPMNRIYLQARILNMYQIPNVTIETKVGRLLIGVYDGIEANENIMRLYNVPLVTSFLQIDITPDGSETIADISSKVEKIIEDFIKITSLYQMVWQDWVSFGIYERDTDALLFFRYSSPKVKISISSPLGKRYDTNEFITTAWNGYTNDLESKYNFDSALEWFIESNGSTLFETQFLNATTCLEMLMDKFHTQNKSELLLDEVTFDELYEVIREAANDFLISKDKIDSKLRASIYSSLRGCNRRAYLEKFRMLIEYWNISIDDIGVRLDEIKDIRNEITHTGRYPINNPEDFKYAEKVYRGLMTILVRLFLAMLNYKKGHFDPWQDQWISEWLIRKF